MCCRVHKGKTAYCDIIDAVRFWEEAGAAYVDLDEWFDVRVEYYKGDANTVRIKFYVNGDLMLVSDHFYGLTQSGGGTPYTSSYARTQVYAMSSAKLSIDFDDCAAYVTDDAYTPATEEDTKIVYNVDANK